ncbi:MAG TPA: ABC transporter substrate-binding protein [Firmicutes bacterium]|nr:ABC transporter substrate-binding protein [Bacillota bacterium]
MKVQRVLCVAMLAVMLACAAVSQAAEVKIRVAGFGGTDTAIVEELIARFVQPNLTGIQVAYEPIPDAYDKWIVNALSAGTGPDLFYVDIFWSQGLFSSGAVEPLDAYLAKSQVLKEKDIIPALLNAFTYGGKVYGIPKDFNTLALIYNKDMFDIAKVAYPDENDDWNTLTDKLRKVQAAFPDVYGVCLSPEFARMGAFAYATGFKNFDKDGKTDILSKEFRDAFNWYTGLAEKGIGVMPADIGQGWGGGALAAEKVAACFEGAWIVGFLRDESPNLNYGAALLPKYPGTGKRGNLTFTVSWSMNATSKHKEEAFKVLEMLTSPEAQQWVLERGLALPSRSALVDNPYFKKTDREAVTNRIVFEGAADGYVMPFEFGKYGGDWMTPINEALVSVMSGQQSADEALKEAQKRLTELIGK